MSESPVGNPIGKAVLLIGIAAGGWYFFRNFEVEGLESIQVRPRNLAESGDVASAPIRTAFDPLDDDAPLEPMSGAEISANRGVPSTLASNRTAPAADDRPATFSATSSGTAAADSAAPVRVASWALAGFDRHKLAKPHVMRWFTGVVQQCDVVALQQVTGRQRDLLPRVIEQLNRGGRRYDFILGPAVGPLLKSPRSRGEVLSEQYAFVFDTERIETDRGQLYTVADAQEAIAYDPLVAWFRVRGVPVERAWTFSLVNFRVDANRSVMEVPLVADIMAAVSADGRGEDDLLLAGMFASDDQDLLQYLGGAEICRAAVRNTPTDIFGRYQLSNILSPRKTTTESLERGGVVNFPKVFGLDRATAEELSPHLPVFADFSATEGQ
jgi:hypothetical protein